MLILWTRKVECLILVISTANSTDSDRMLYCFSYFADYFFIGGRWIQIYTEVSIDFSRQWKNSQFYII
jgi:hypothetical protein